MGQTNVKYQQPRMKVMCVKASNSWRCLSICEFMFVRCLAPALRHEPFPRGCSKHACWFLDHALAAAGIGSLILGVGFLRARCLAPALRHEPFSRGCSNHARWRLGHALAAVGVGSLMWGVGFLRALLSR